MERILNINSDLQNKIMKRKRPINHERPLSKNNRLIPISNHHLMIYTKQLGLTIYPCEDLPHQFERLLSPFVH